MSTSPDPHPRRRSAEITIDGRRFRVREPDPTIAWPILVAAQAMLGEWLTQILSGRFLRIRPALCPECGGAEAESFNGRWLCTTVRERAGQESAPCRNMYPQERETDDHGRPVAVTIGYALERPEWRAKLALEIQGALERLDPREAMPLARQVLLGHLDVWAMNAWITIREAEKLDEWLPHGMAIQRLMRCAAECWILPSLVVDWTDTAPASPTSETDGGSGPAPSSPPGASASRVPPRTSKQRVTRTG